MTISSYSSPSDSPRSVTDKNVPWKSAIASPKIGKVTLQNDRPGRVTLTMRKMSAANRQRQMSSILESSFNTSSYLYDNMNESRCTYASSSSFRGPLPTFPTMSDPSEIGVKRSKKNVSFSSMATVHTIAVEKQDKETSSWYTKRDYAKFELDRQNTLRLIQTANRFELELLESQGAICMVGLERTLSRRQALQRKYLTMQHRYSVLQEQQQRINNATAVTERLMTTLSADATLASFESQIYHLEAQIQRRQAPTSKLCLAAMLDEAISLSPRTFVSR
jgi:hypothetical protein